MPDSRTLWTAVVIICIAVSVFFSVKKRTTFKRLQQLMAAKQWDEFDRLLDGKLTSMLYPRYNRDYLRLNSYLLREDHKRADEMFDLLLGLNLPKMQRVDLVIKAFNYYVGQEDRKKSKELLHEIKGFEGGQAEAVAHECQLMYDTMILKRHNDIPELERMLEEAGDDKVKGCRLEYLLALQYKNKATRPSLPSTWKSRAGTRWPSTRNERLVLDSILRGRGGIGIRRRLKISRRKDCGFESHRPYHMELSSRCPQGMRAHFF